MDFCVGELVICTASGVIGTVIKLFRPTASQVQLMVKTLDGRKYHAPISMWRHCPMVAEAGQSASMSVAAPVLRETMEIHVDGKTLTVYKDDIENELYSISVSDLCSWEGGCHMCTDDFIEAWRACIEQVSRVFESLKKFAESINKSYRLPKKHFKPARNSWKQCNTRNLYKVERKVQKHLPYQRRNY